MANKFNIDILLKVFAEGQNSFKELADGFKQIAKVGDLTARKLAGIRVSDKAVKDIQKIEAELNDLNEAIGKVQKINFDTQRADVFSSKLKLIVKDLDAVQRQARDANDELSFSNAAIAQANARRLLEELQKISKESNTINNRFKEFAIKAKLNNELAKITKSVTTLSKELEVAKKRGDEVKINDITPQLVSINKELTLLANKFKKVGDVSKVQIIVREQDKVKNLRKEIEALTPAILAVNRNKIVVQAKAENDFSDIKKKISSLQNELNTFLKKNKVITVEAKIQFKQKAEEIQKQLAQVGSQLPKGREDAFLQAGVRIADFRKKLQSLQTALPPTFFDNLGKGFRTVFTSAGGAAGALRGLAGVFRLAGTTAFVAQLRTLGFALTAVASIIQNFLPVLTGLISGLAELGPIGIALGGIISTLAISFTILASKVTLTFAAIASVIPTGIQFNRLLEDTVNGTAAIVSQFFELSEAGKLIEGTFTRGGETLTRFQAAQEVVRAQLERLENIALGTLFTTEELTRSLQTTAIAFGGLAPSVEAVTDIVGRFAGVAGILGISSSELASSITQVVSGVGRVTNPLQRFLNQVKDSEGITLTAKRIRELRAEGGTKLFDELSLALGRFSEEVRKANEQSFTGVISNFQDLFQIVSRRATLQAFNIIRVGLNGVFNSLTQFDRKTGIRTLGEDLQRLVAILDSIIQKVAVDVVIAAQKLAGYVDDIANFLEENYDNIVDIYDLTVLIVENVGSILNDLAKIFLLASDTSEQFSGIKVVLGAISIILSAVRLNLSLVLTSVSLIVLAFSELIRNALKFTRLLIIAGTVFNPTQFKGVTQVIDQLNSGIQFFDSVSNRAARGVVSSFKEAKDAISDVSKVTDILSKKNEKLQKSQDKNKSKITTKGSGQAEVDEEKARRERIRSTLEAELGLSDALRKLQLQREQNQLRLVQDRLKREQALIQAALDANLISQQEASDRILAIAQSEISNEITSRRNAITILNKERLEKEAAFQTEVGLLNQQAKKDPKKGGLSQVELRNRLDQLGIKQKKELIELQTREEAIQGEINQLEESRRESQQQFVFDIVKRTKETERELQIIRQTVADLKGQNSQQAISLRILGVIEERLELIKQLENEITGIRKVRDKTTDLATRKVLSDQLGIAQERLRLLQEEIVLRQQNIRFEAAESIADEVKFNSELRENELQRQLNQGIIDERDYVIQVTAERIRLREGLLKVLEVEKKILEANPGNPEQIKKVKNLQEEIDNLKTTITDERLLKATNDIKENFTGFLVDLQDESKNAADSIKNFANSVLGTFRRLLAEKIVREFFSTLFPKEGQTEGRPGGIIASIFRGLGLGVDEEQKKAEQKAKEKGSVLDEKQDSLLDILRQGSINREEVFGNSLDNLTNALTEATLLIQEAIKNLASSLSTTLPSVGNIGIPPITGLNFPFPEGNAKGGLVPARVSNGEYRMSPKAVSKYGSGFMSKINSFAQGGPNFNQFIPPAIKNKIPPRIIGNEIIPKRKKPGKFKKLFGNILSFAAPFLGLIPGVGPFLQLGAGALGGALTGDDARTSILGGIFGGLGNLGGFKGSKGPLGGLSNFFGSKQGNLLLSLFGGRNLGSFGGSSLLAILKKLGLGRGPLVDAPFPSSGRDVYAAYGGLIKKKSKRYAQGGGVGLDSLLPLLSIFGGLFNRPAGQKETPFVEDPDLPNINRYGSALRSLRDQGVLQDVFYTKEAADFLSNQGRGTSNTNSKTSSLGGLQQLLPFLLLGLQGNAKGGAIDSRGYGLIKGPGTGKSDSIFAMLSNGEFIIRADAVKALGTDVLDSINQGRFASGGLVGENTVSTIPQSRFNPTVNVENKQNVVNLLDPNLLQDYLNTSEGKGALLNIISRNPKSFNNALRK